MSIAYAEYETVTHSERFVPRQASAPTTLLHCLIVAEDTERREFFRKSAEAAGWQATVCADAIAATNAANRFRHTLMLVDLADTAPGNATSLRSFAEQLSGNSRQLLVVCGEEGNPLEEIWARQLGVWLYLAGVDSSCDISSLCSEARQVADKLNPPLKPTYARTA